MLLTRHNLNRILKEIGLGICDISGDIRGWTLHWPLIERVEELEKRAKKQDQTIEALLEHLGVKIETEHMIFVEKGQK